MLFVLSQESTDLSVGTGKRAGDLSEWGFAGESESIRNHHSSSHHTAANNAGSEYEQLAVSLNHQEGLGDRQSSRQGSRRKKRATSSSNGTGKSKVCKLLFEIFFKK